MEDAMRSIAKWRSAYERKPDAPIYMKEFGYYSLDRWRRDGDIPAGYDDGQAQRYIADLFGFDAPGHFALGGLGWCEAGFVPIFEEKVLEDRGDYELVQDFAGRGVLCFKGRRSGFMPEYVSHPVEDQRTWEERCKWRMDPETPERWAGFEERMGKARAAVEQGKMIQLNLVGGYMYLRSLMGPVELLYAFYDQPELIHDCMRTWLTLAEATAARYQRFVDVDEVFIGEDICYNKGPLISPAHMREFLFPYYQQLLTGVRGRNKAGGHVYFQVDTDGDCRPVIDLYRELGMDVMSPFEGASGCDVVREGMEHPWMMLSGGIDKRILATTKDAIDREIDRILPAMKRRGGYIPTCDHGVPEEVSFENFAHYRRRLLEFA